MYRNWITIALRKPGKDDYSQPKSYQPIVLLNKMGKSNKLHMAKRIQTLAEKFHLLPNTQLGGRKPRSTEHGIHYILERTFSAWSKGKIVTLLLLHVAGAFDKVSHQRLLHDLRRKGMPEAIVRWIESVLSDRMTILKTSEYTSGITRIWIVIPQARRFHLSYTCFTT